MLILGPCVPMTNTPPDLFLWPPPTSSSRRCLQKRPRTRYGGAQTTFSHQKVAPESRSSPNRPPTPPRVRRNSGGFNTILDKHDSV